MLPPPQRLLEEAGELHEPRLELLQGQAAEPEHLRALLLAQGRDDAAKGVAEGASWRRCEATAEFHKSSIRKYGPRLRQAIYLCVYLST